MVTGNAHVVGGGIAGLAVAACLSQRHWNVTVHERSPELREIGAGIGIKENSIRVMEELGCWDPIFACSHRIKDTFINDRPGHHLRRYTYGPERVFTVRRQDLHRELGRAAERWGAKILLNSSVLGANTDGEIFTTSGQHRADLIVAADGQGSLIRKQIGLGSAKDMNSGSTRVLVPRKSNDLPNTSCEYWRGHRRILLMPLSDSTLYVCASTREDDKRGTSLPLDIPYWSESFPELSDVLARIPADEGTHFAHGQVKVSAWYRGRVALVGDAAHGQPPNLGQGAGMAISNARALADTLERHDAIDPALEIWERECKRFSSHVQNWSIAWEHVMHRWPLMLEPLRSYFVLSVANFPGTKKHWRSLYRGIKEK